MTSNQALNELLYCDEDIGEYEKERLEIIKQDLQQLEIVKELMKQKKVLKVLKKYLNGSLVSKERENSVLKIDLKELNSDEFYLIKWWLESE